MNRPSLTLLQLAALAERTWDQSQPGDVIWLTGELGAGKTTFARLVGTAAGAPDGTSPTYALVHEYDSPHGLIVHADCYRLDTPADALDLDLLEQAKLARLTMIEWPERGGAFVPEPNLRIDFGHADATDRRHVLVSS